MDLDDLMDMKGPYYYIYDLKSEDIPSEEEWMMRIRVFHKNTFSKKKVVHTPTTP